MLTGESSVRKKRNFLTNDQRRAISQLLMHSSHNGKLYPGMIRRVALIFNVHTSVIYRIWNQVKKTGDACHKKTTNCGRKRIQLDPQKFCEVPLAQRTTLQSLSCALGINKTTLIRLLKAGVIRRNSNALKPYLKDDNKVSRLK
jgi:DNA invertase Pin-like site-specific DNA recombinase